HFHMRERDLVPGEHFAHAGIDALLEHETVGLRGLLEMREVRALNTLLAHPDVARIECEIVAGSAGAEYDHAAALHDETGHRKRLFARMLEHNVDIPLACDVPDPLAEAARFLRPVIELRRIHRWHLAPALEILAIDDTLGAKIEDVFDLRVV